MRTFTRLTVKGGGWVAYWGEKEDFPNMIMNGVCKMVKKVKRVLAVVITLVLVVSMLGNSKLIAFAENNAASKQETTEMSTVAEEEIASAKEASAGGEDKQIESSTVIKNGETSEQEQSQKTVEETLAGEDEKTKSQASASEAAVVNEVEDKENTSEKVEKITTASEESKQEKPTAAENNATSEQEKNQESDDKTTKENETIEEAKQDTTENAIQAITEQEQKDTLQSVAEQEQKDLSENSAEQEAKAYKAEAVVDQTRIKVTAEAGVLPSDAILKAKALKEDGDTSAQYSEAKAALDKENSIEYDGFMAYDIGFTDSTGQEIEPTGKVSVSMEMATPEGAESESLSVQHHEKTASGIQVETVADAKNETSGKVDVQGQETLAEFEVESFSTFTIVWKNKDGIPQEYINVTFVDQNGEAIPYTSAGTVMIHKDSSYGNSTIALENYAYRIEGYEYVGAKIGSITGNDVTEVSMQGNGNSTYLQYRNGDSRWGNLKQSNIVLIYNGSTPIDPTPVPEISLAHDKYVTSNDNGTYNLTLTVSGDVGSQEKKQPVDVIYVLDKSGSMADSMKDDSDGSGKDIRRIKAGDAINAMTNSLASNNNLDMRFSLVTFSRYEEITVGWTNNATDITNASKPSSGGGTNYQGGLIGAKDLLKSARADAMTVVVFVSDGDPTYHYDSNGKLVGGGNNDDDGSSLNAAITAVGTLSSDYFFTVGVGPSKNYDKLRELKNAAANVPEANREFYEGINTEALENAFNDIQSSITYLTCTNVTVTDNLTDNVNIVMENGQPKALHIEVVGKDGNVVASGNNEVTIDGKKITASYDETSKQIVLDFPDDYALVQGYTYKVIATIEATENAYDKYRTNNNQYPDTGENGTGETSAGQAGVFTNTNATVNYTYNDESKELEYPKPVIQLNPGTLVIKKEITGLESDEEALNTLKASLAFDVSLNGATKPTEYGISKFKYDEQSKKYTYTITGLSPNTSYKITEKGNTVSGYDLTKTPASGEIEGAVSGGDTKTVTFTNAYAPSNRTITVKKVVDGNMSDTDKDFDFTYKIGNGEEQSFKIKHNETRDIENIPSGSTVVITEIDNDGYKTSWEIGGNMVSEGENQKSYTCTVTQDMTIVCINQKDGNPPTGMTHNQTPFALMLMAALLLAICGFGRFMLRRVRR